MEEFIGYGLVVIVLATLIFLFRKLFKRNNNSLGNGDEIILDSDMVHYGPFSGNPGQQHFRKFVFLLSISSSFLAADIELQTIDNWGISSFGSETLMMQKTSEDSHSNLFIEMRRPFCICAEPMITTSILTKKYNIGDHIEAQMTINKLKSKKMMFVVKSIFDDGVHLLKLRHYPSIRDADNIKVRFLSNIASKEMLFDTKGMSKAMKQSETICFSEYILGQSEDENTV